MKSQVSLRQLRKHERSLVYINVAAQENHNIHCRRPYYSQYTNFTQDEKKSPIHFRSRAEPNHFLRLIHTHVREFAVVSRVHVKMHVRLSVCVCKINSQR